MRWLLFILVSLVGIIFQNTICQLLWFRTSVGWIGPDVLAGIAVFFALFSRSGIDAAICGWILGFLLDLTITAPAPSVGLLPLLYAAATAGIFQIRDAFFKEKILTQMVLTFLFCIIVYGIWMSWDVATNRMITPLDGALQVIGVALYSAIIAPLICAVLWRFGKYLVPAEILRKRQ